VETGGRVVLTPEAGGRIFEAAVPVSVFATLLPPAPDATEPIPDALNSFAHPAALCSFSAFTRFCVAASSQAASSLEMGMILA
jgi:hypothetical protein